MTDKRKSAKPPANTPESLVKAAKTRWRNKVIKESGAQVLQEAEDLIAQGGFAVFVHSTDETSRRVWAIGVVAKPDFWLDAFLTEAKARAQCKHMGWTVQERRP
jgi:hypothetical protein